MALPRVGYTSKISIMYLLSLADLLINAAADHQDKPPTDDWIPYVFVGCVAPLRCWQQQLTCYFATP